MPRVHTVKELRAFLDEMEAGWTEQDDRMLGKFEDQEIRVPYYSRTKFSGYGPAHANYDVTGMGFIIDQPNI